MAIVGNASPPPSTANGTMGVFVLSARRTKPDAELDERVALAKELRRPARPFGEHHEQAVVLEQPLGVLRQPGEVARARLPTALMKGTRLMNFSTIPCASRGGSISSRHEAMTIAPSIAMPPEWLPTSIARPRVGTCSMPRVSTEKYQR